MAKPLLPARELAWPGPAWVGDARQGHGAGALLVRAILHQLAQRGARTAMGIMEPGNLAIRRLVNRVALDATTLVGGGSIVSVPLADWAARPDARS